MIGTRRRTQHHRGMASGQRGWVYLIMGALWLSGCIWLCLDQFFTVRGPFGKTPHPWQAPLVLLHGVIAISSMYLLGWISARHATHSWIRRQRRISGGVLSSFLTVLIVSGFALFFVSDDQWQRIAAVIHEVSGLALTPIAIQHWFLRQRNQAAREETVTNRC
jgi:hypothetical protein